MRFLKSFFAGIITILIGLILFLIGGIAYFAVISSKMPEGTAIGWDPISLVHQSILSWVALSVLFLIGFTWQFRRTRAYR